MALLNAYIACVLKMLDYCDATGKVDRICIRIRALCTEKWAVRFRPADKQQIASPLPGCFRLQFVRRAR